MVSQGGTEGQLSSCLPQQEVQQSRRQGCFLSPAAPTKSGLKAGQTVGTGPEKKGEGEWELFKMGSEQA